MFRLKLAVFSLLISLPLIGGASTLTKFESLVGTSSPDLLSYEGQDSTIISTSDGFFVDLWTLVVDQNEIASIAFNSLDLSTTIGSKTVDFLKISPFNVSPGEVFGLTDLSAGEYHFTISGTSSGINGGLYSVGTAVITAVPLPAAVWFFGTVLFGFLSISKHRNQL
jgi:hypothetical protein